MPDEPVVVEEEKVADEAKAGEGGISDDEDEKVGAGEDTEGEVETLAKEMGWRPKEDFNGDDADYVDATAYIKKGQDIQDSMRKSLKDQKRQLSDMSGSLADLKTHNERVFKAEVANLKKELTSLRAEKEEAITDGDVKKVNEIDERIETVKESITPIEKTQQRSEPQQPDGTPEFKKWLKGNQWYNDDDEMAQYADEIATEHKGASFQRIATLVDKKVREIFPDKFSTEQGNVATANRVEGSARRRASGKFTEADLSSSQKSIMKQFVKQKIMTKKAYIEDIAKVAGGAE